MTTRHGSAAGRRLNAVSWASIALLAVALMAGPAVGQGNREDNRKNPGNQPPQRNEPPAQRTPPPQREAPPQRTPPPQREVPQQRTPPPQREAPPQRTPPPQREVPQQRTPPARKEVPQQRTPPPQREVPQQRTPPARKEVPTQRIAPADRPRPTETRRQPGNEGSEAPKASRPVRRDDAVQPSKAPPKSVEPKPATNRTDSIPPAGRRGPVDTRTERGKSIEGARTDQSKGVRNDAQNIEDVRKRLGGQPGAEPGRPAPDARDIKRDIPGDIKKPLPPATRPGKPDGKLPGDIKKPLPPATRPGKPDGKLPGDIKKPLPPGARPIRPDGKLPGDIKKPLPPGTRPGTPDGKLPGDIKHGRPGPVAPGAKLPPGAGRHDPHDVRFADRMKAGDFDRLYKGEAAKKMQISQQYRMYRQGDVARRLELERHRHPAAFYRGPIAPAYANHCFKYHYWGPTFFAGACLYPVWSPWVEWSWGFHCHPYWDPRPIWCRPIIYTPCSAWVYWETPTWTVLPSVACGTWVDVKPVVLPAAQSDLQLLAVRFVDPGHPEEKTGPRYRVWFRNNGSQPITHPFNVMLFAGLNGQLTAGLPQAGVRVAAIDPGDTQSVDVRLPVGVYQAGRDAQGNAVPFNRLHVLVDATRETHDAIRANNGAHLVPGEILPVDPAAFQADPVAAQPGGEVLVAGEGFGPQPGRVLVQVNGQELDAEILGWYDLGVKLALPKLALTGPTDADIIVIRGDGAAANPLRVTLQ